MFWILKRSKFTANLFNSVINNNILYKDPARNTKRGYDRLTTNDDDPNGNTSPIHLAAPPSSTVTTPTEGEVTTPLTPMTPSTDMEVTSTGSASVVESSSDYDHCMSQSDSDDSDVDDDDDEDDDDDDDDDDEEDDDEARTCNVCDRSFPTTRLLASHQTRKRHYGCSICENVFPTLMSLEAHKEESNHWSDDDLFLDDDDDDDLEDYYYDDEENEEEREQLL
ncbi:uncharacterized protein LOC135224303 [Macrobrachium nipponense]|uniref:uncharacterized protein LOC135224303 n=1 Tax=Macrobrachium nipponense TaxID=159736 RepID=UPI0030C7C224